MNALVRLISLLQIIGGLVGLVATCNQALAFASTGGIAIAPIIVIAIYLVSLAAGVELWRGRPSGRQASIVVQAIQLPKIVSPAITFMMSFGFDLWVQLLVQAGFLNLGFEFRFLAFNQFFVNTPGAPIGFGVSLASCLFLPVLIRYKPQPNPQHVAHVESSDHPTT